MESLKVIGFYIKSIWNDFVVLNNAKIDNKTSFWDRIVHTRRGLCISRNRTREGLMSFLKFLKSKVTQISKNNFENILIVILMK